MLLFWNIVFSLYAYRFWEPRLFVLRFSLLGLHLSVFWNVPFLEHQLSVWHLSFLGKIVNSFTFCWHIVIPSGVYLFFCTSRQILCRKLLSIYWNLKRHFRKLRFLIAEIVLTIHFCIKKYFMLCFLLNNFNYYAGTVTSFWNFGTTVFCKTWILTKI